MIAKVITIYGLIGYFPITYAVCYGEKIIKIFTNKKDAEAFCKTL